MLKFIKGHMQTIDGVELFPLITFVMFFTFFIFMSYLVIKMRKSDIDHMSALPLESNNSNKKENL